MTFRRCTRATFTRLVLVAAVTCAMAGAAAAQPGFYGQALRPGELSPEAEIALHIDPAQQQKVLGSYPPLDGTFYDHENSAVTVRQLMADKPTLLVPAYFLCPKLCNEVLANLMRCLRDARDADPTCAVGRAFNVVVFSIDAREDYTLSGPKRDFTLQQYDEAEKGGKGRTPTATGWWYVTASDRQLGQKAKAEATIRELTDALAFPFKMDKRGKDIQHPGAAVLLTPDGRVSRYFTNIMFDPTDVRAAIREASVGKVAPPDEKQALACFNFDQMKPMYRTVMLVLGLTAAPFALLAVGLTVRSWTRARRDRAVVDGLSSTSLSPPWNGGEVEVALPRTRGGDQGCPPPKPADHGESSAAARDTPDRGPRMFAFMDTPPLLPEQASRFAVGYDLLYWYISLVCGFGAAVVYGLLLYCCVRFAKRDGDARRPMRILGSNKLEILWTVIPLLFFLSFFVFGVRMYDDAINPPKGATRFEYFVVGKQWMWKVQGPEGQRQINEITLPCPDEGDSEPVTVKVTGTSEDVIHDFGIPAFRSKFDVVPGRYTSAWYAPTAPGTYHLFCDQYCGQGHSQMVGRVNVLRKKDYQAWLDGEFRTRPGKHPVDGSPAWEGRKLFHKLQCNGCHNREETAKAPNLEQIYGTRRQLQGGGSVLADEEYIRNSIRNPTLHVREGWRPIMPAFTPALATENDLYCLVQYIKSLKAGDLPTRNEQTPAPLGAPPAQPPSPGDK